MSSNSSRYFTLKRFLDSIFSPKSPISFLGLVLITTFINLLAAGNPLGIAGVFVIALLWWWINRKFQEEYQQKLIERSRIAAEKQPPKPVPGLILLLSPYSSQNPLLKSSDILIPLVNRICQTPFQELTQADFDALDLLKSNLVPQIKAIEYHLKGKRLEKVWLISTQTYEVKNQKTGNPEVIKGSEKTAILLEKYLTFKYGNQLKIYHQEFRGVNLSVKDGNYGELYQVINTIFQQSDYKNEVIIADITGGTKMMSVALAMACVPSTNKRKMQYMDSKRDWEGNPLSHGEIQPVVIDVDLILNLDD